MKNKLKIAAAVAVLILLFASCQQVFTTSAFSFVKTDITTMNDDQKISYAQDLLSSGTTEQLAEAYTQIAAMLPDDLSDADPDLVILAADLAIGSSGIGDAVTGALEVFTSEQYTNAAAAQILVVLDQVEALGVADPSSLDENVPEQAAIIDDLEQALTWAEAGGVDLSMFGEGIALP